MTCDARSTTRVEFTSPQPGLSLHLRTGEARVRTHRGALPHTDSVDAYTPLCVAPCTATLSDLVAFVRSDPTARPTCERLSVGSPLAYESKYLPAMPYIDVRTSAAVRPKVRDALLGDLVSTTAKHLGKPEDVTMARLGLEEAMLFKGSAAPAAFVSIRAIGLPDVATRAALVASLSSLFEEVLGVTPDRTFVVFEDVPRDRWGVRGTILD